MDSKIEDSWSLVTGASSGLGVEFARQLAGRGSNIVLVARRRERLEEVARDLRGEFGVETLVLPKDLTLEDAPDELYHEIAERGLEVDVLVNNAGLGQFGEYTDLDWTGEKALIDLDIAALAYLTRLFSSDMVERGRGYILQVSSMTAYQPTPLYASYAAAKSFVLSFGEALHEELAGTGVSCTVVSPGVTRTAFMDKIGQELTPYQRMMIMETEEVARVGIEAMLRGKSSVVPGLMNKTTVLASRFMPRWMSAKVARWTMESSGGAH
jgi:hypothetical protein